jgi:putative membrane protein
MKMVELGKIMSEKAQKAEVKQFASQMVEAHTKMMSKLKTTCKEINCEFPEKPNAEDQKIITQFRDEKSQNLDEAYMKLMVETHEKAVKMLTQAHKEAKDPQLQECSGEALKVMDEHLKKAQTILKDLKA